MGDGMRKIFRWWKKDKGHKYINGGKGVISILLVIVMLPFAYFADWMVEGARYHSSVSLLDEAIDSSNLSVMSNYDTYLYNRFGLSALSNDVDISEEFNTYLDANTASLNSWNITSATASGMYALSDNEILLKQVAEFSQYGAATSLVVDLALGDLISMLEKMTQMTDIIDIVTGIGKTTDALLTLAESLEELRTLTSKYTTDKNKYIEKYNAFASTYDQLVHAINEKNHKSAEVRAIEKTLSESEEVARMNALIDQTINELELLEEKKENGELTEEEYEIQRKEKEEKLEEYEKQLEEAIEADNVLQNEYETAKSELEAANNLVEQNKANLNTAKTEYVQSIEVLISDMEEYQETADEVVEGLASCVSSAIDLGVKIQSTAVKESQTMQDLKDEQKELQEKISSETDAAKKAEYEKSKAEIDKQIADMNAGTTNVKAAGQTVKDEISEISENVQDAIDEYNKEDVEKYISDLTRVKERVGQLQISDITGNSALDKALYYVEINSGFMSEGTISNLITVLENRLKGNGFWDLVDMLSVALKSLFTTDLFFDSRLTAYIKEDSGYTASQIDAILQDISTLISLTEGVQNSILPWITILLKLNQIIDALVSLVEHVGIYLSGIMTRAVVAVQELISEQCGEKILLSEYMVKTLSDRSDMNVNGKISGKNILTGFSFSNVKFVEHGQNEVPIIGDIQALRNLFTNIQQGGNDIMFSGAEVEYILTGSRSEIVNQASVFLQIYFVRFFIDFAQILLNEEVDAIATAAGSATLGIGAVVVYIIYVFLEPLIDTILIVNGEEISLFHKVVYFSPTGCTALLPRLTKLGIKSEYKAKFSAGVESFLEQEKISGCSNKDDKGIKWQYSDYLFALMLVFVDNDTCMERFRNIVNLESKAYYGQEKFDINKTYTYVKGEVSGEFEPVLPLGGIIGNSLFKQQRSRMRGY